MVSRTRFRTRYRCNRVKCRTRFSVKHSAKRPPKCPGCGETVMIRNVEQDRRRELSKQERCYCNAYPFPHRSGSLRACIDHPLIVNNVPMTDEEHYQYMDCLNTKRSSFS